MIRLNPLEDVLDRSHIWRGSNAMVWYQEGPEGGCRVVVLSDVGGCFRRVVVEIDATGKATVADEEISAALFEELRAEVKYMEELFANAARGRQSKTK